MSRKKLTVYDYLQCKGKRQLSVMFVHNADEAAAAEEAGIDRFVLLMMLHNLVFIILLMNLSEYARLHQLALCNPEVQ